MPTTWEWDESKAKANLAKHGVSFPLARLIFEDIYLLSLPDPHPSDERWRTLGKVGGVVLFVVHTAPECRHEGGEEIGRIISARKATASERRAYEDG
jgi:hypothetical protein